MLEICNLRFSMLSLFNRVTTKDKAFVARQLATMLSSGLTLDKALTILHSQIKNPLLKKTLKQVIEDLKKGKTFSEALKIHPKVFDRIFVNIVVSGEAVGKLAEVLTRLADQLEQQDVFISKVRNGLYYPLFIIFVMMIIMILMMIYVIPPLKEVFEEFGSQLPWTTTALINISDFVATYWMIVFSVLGILIVLMIYFFRTKQGKLILNKIAINYTSGLGKDIYMARFAQTMSMLIQAGTPIIEAIEITGEVMNNIVYQRVLSRVMKQMEKGVPMSVQLEKSKSFPTLIPQMISVGEQTGKLEEVLNNLARYYEEESNSKLKTINSLFEPVIIVLIGLGVAFIVFSVIMPIYQIAELG